MIFSTSLHENIEKKFFIYKKYFNDFCAFESNRFYVRKQIFLTMDESRRGFGLESMRKSTLKTKLN